MGSGEADVPPADTRRKGGNDSFGELRAKRDEVKQLNTSHKDIRGRKFTSPILRVLSKGSFRRDPTQQTSMLKIQQKTKKKIQSLCLLIFF